MRTDLSGKFAVVSSCGRDTEIGGHFLLAQALVKFISGGCSRVMLTMGQRGKEEDEKILQSGWWRNFGAVEPCYCLRMHTDGMCAVTSLGDSTHASGMCAVASLVNPLNLICGENMAREAQRLWEEPRPRVRKLRYLTYLLYC